MGANGADITLNASTVTYNSWVHFQLYFDFVNMRVTLYKNGEIAIDSGQNNVSADI